MKIIKQLIIALVIVVGSCFAASAQEQTNEFLMTWTATGYTTNAHGRLIATNLTQRTLINIVAADNGINPNDCAFVYRVEKRDTAVVWKNTGAFIADVYQLQYTFLDVTNPAGTEGFCESTLNDEYHDGPIGSSFGMEQKTFNQQGYLTAYSYHGSFHLVFPENNVVFTGTFSTGARVREK